MEKVLLSKFHVKFLLAKDLKYYDIFIVNKHFIINMDLKISKNVLDKYMLELLLKCKLL
jgi:hypothetical protein